ASGLEHCNDGLADRRRVQAGESVIQFSRRASRNGPQAVHYTVRPAAVRMTEGVDDTTCTGAAVWHGTRGGSATCTPWTPTAWSSAAPATGRPRTGRRWRASPPTTTRR